MAVLAEFGRKAEETRQLHASSPGAGEGNCRRFVVIDSSHSELKVSAVPRRALTFLSVVFRGMGIHGLTLLPALPCCRLCCRELVSRVAVTTPAVLP